MAGKPLVQTPYTLCSPASKRAVCSLARFEIAGAMRTPLRLPLQHLRYDGLRLSTVCDLYGGILPSCWLRLQYDAARGDLACKAVYMRAPAPGAGTGGAFVSWFGE